MITFIKSLFTSKRIIKIKNGRYIPQVYRFGDIWFRWAGIDANGKLLDKKNDQLIYCSVESVVEANERIYGLLHFEKVLREEKSSQKKDKVILTEPEAWVILQSQQHK